MNVANHLRSTDNRNMVEMERVYLARIEALRAALANANYDIVNLRTALAKAAKLLNKRR